MVSARWWKKAVVYQIYPRSFMDSDGDGVGDLPGITARLDHLRDLGVDAVWLGPHYDSPNADNGYDIRDYREIMPAFGTMADFEEMLAQMQARGLRLILDLVVNHTSDQHAWFVQSRQGRENPFRDFYIWRDGRDGGPPNNYPSIFGGPAWTFDEASGQYYLHSFTPGQPDLNWDNPRVRAEVYDIMRFWLDKGVSGFRMDVIAFISKRPGLPDLTVEELAHPERVYANGPRLHDYLREMNREVLSRYDAMSVGEAFGVAPEHAALLTDERRGELSMAFDFSLVDLLRTGGPHDWTLPQFKAVIARQDRSTGAHGWNGAFLGNHDQPRAVSHFGDDHPDWRMASAKTLASVLLTQRATPFIYQGEEIAIANAPFADIADFDDVWAKTLWREQVETGRASAEAVLDRLRRSGRDNARTPMQWSPTVHGGFTTGAPWLKVNPDSLSVNVAAQAQDDGSVLSHYRRLIALRKSESALVHGDFGDLEPSHPTVFAYTRRLGAKAFLVVANFDRNPIEYALSDPVRPTALVLSSEKDIVLPKSSVRLKGWHSVIFEIESR